MSSPSISVVIPAYNAGEWIDETLASVLAQSEPADEVIVVDDGSTDDTRARATAHGDAVLVAHQANGGPPAAYNHGFRLATSEFVAMCPADDVWDAGKLREQRAALREHPEVDVTFSGARHFGLGDHPYPGPTRGGVQRAESFGPELYAADVVPAPTAVVRRALWDRLGAFREDLPSEDYEFWLRALQAGATFYYDPRKLVRLRLHGSNVSQRALAIWEMNHAIHAEYRDLAGDDKRAQRVLARDLRAIGRCRLGLDDARGASVAYRAALRHEPAPAGAAWALATSLPGAGAAARRLNRWRRARA